MKSLHLLFVAWIGFGIISCSQPAEKPGTGDTTVNSVIPPKADNSQATNPSLADTGFSKNDTMHTGPDSSRVKK